MPEQYSWADLKSAQGYWRLTNSGNGSFSFYPKNEEGRTGESVLLKENTALMKLPDDYEIVDRDQGGIRKKSRGAIDKDED